MKQPGFGITQFVRGMAWHDVAKPFALGTPRHAALGYWLLRLAGYDGEALVALAHGHNKKKIQKLRRQLASRNPKTVEQAHRELLAEPLLRYFRHVGEPIPGLLVLCNLLDHLAASVYSLLSRGLQTDCHSLQNPFSRLPDPILGWKMPFAIPESKRERLESVLWKRLRADLPDEWKVMLTDKTKRDVENRNQPLPAPDALPAGRDASKVLMRHMAHYPERTYPSVNDTSLEQHCRLSGILAFVVCRNLERGEADLLQEYITYADGEVQYPILDPARVVREHLEASLIRVAFEGHRALFEDAVRVDDLHGARGLTELTREAFKQALAHQSDSPDLADFLTISESQFDLVYLLPPANVSLETIIHDAYEMAVGQVAGQIASRLERDFPQIGSQQDKLEQQLGDISYGLHITPVDVSGDGGFNEAAAQYGHNLLQAYQDSQDYATFPTTSLPGGASWRGAAETLAAAESCEVCGNYPILVPPEDLDDEARAEWQKKHDYAAHIFRGEREHICLSCVARRTLAYGKIAKQMDPIVRQMLKPDASQPRLWRSVEVPDGPELPPLLASTVSLARDDELLDVGAFYVRYHRTRDGVDHSALDIFPTTSYAADATGNVILLSLQPTRHALFASYPYDEALKKLGSEQRSGDSPPDGDTALWQDTFVKFHRKVAQEVEARREKGEQAPDLSESIRHVQPHLARVMERIQRIQVFYDDLYDRLAKGPSRLRVLPLDTDYPTLRLLLPADKLDQVLCVLDRVMTESLFSATAAETPDERAALHGLLELLVPDLLHGAVVLFKQKFPLYLVLEAERDLFHKLAVTDGRGGPSGRPSRSDWYGLRLAFTDLRGTLSQVAPKRAEVTYEKLGLVLGLAGEVDRRTVLLRGELAAQEDRGWTGPPAEDQSEEDRHAVANAVTIVRANRIGLPLTQAEALNDENIFKPVLFLKRAIRR